MRIPFFNIEFTKEMKEAPSLNTIGLINNSYFKKVKMQNSLQENISKE